MRNVVAGMIRKIHEEVQQKVAINSKRNPKAFWSYINKFRRNREQNTDLKTLINGKEARVKGDQEKAELMAEFFASVYLKEPFLTQKTLFLKELCPNTKWRL